LSRRLIQLEMNRVEGDLQIKLEVEKNTVTDAWCIGSMYRGYEQVLIGREPTDALVIAPRICGICSTSQLYAATLALEDASQIPVAPNGTRIRNLCLMAEAVMNDARHTFLMFAPDFCNPAYRNHPLYDPILAAFEPPFKGRLARETVHSTKQILGIIVAFGGQWPHSTYMMPGGVTCPVNREKLVNCLDVIQAYAKWYQTIVLGCAFDRWLSLRTVDDLHAWLDESESHRDSAVGLFTRFGRSIGLQHIGKGTSNLLSAGCYYDPEKWQAPYRDRHCLIPGGFYDAERREISQFSHAEVSEHVRYSWFEGYEGGRHPWMGENKPEYSASSDRYSFAKAPRYKGKVVQLGPLAELVIAGDPLITSFFRAEGPNTWLRQFTRLHRPVAVLRAMEKQVREIIANLGEPTFMRSEPRSDGTGYGFINAARGSLGHWLKVRGGKIENYQVITPTTWNGSPRDSWGRRGHWEESFIGLEIRDLDNPVEVGHLIRSHDACLVCTVHFANTGRRNSFSI
jgi:uptake hydrogenase large subunit